MTFVERLDDFQRRHAIVGYPLGVVYKFIDDQGAYLAALITYYGLLSIFPLLLLLTSLLGFLVQNNDQLRENLLQGVISNIPVIGDELAQPRGLQGSLAAVIVGGLVAMYGGLGVAQALQNAMNTVWAVPRFKRPNPILARAKSALILLFLGVTLVGAAALPTFVPVLSGWLHTAFSTVSAVLVFWVLLHVSTHHQRLRWRTLLPGAVFIGLVWRILEELGGSIINGVMARSSGSYGVFAVVLGLIAWIFVLSVSIVIAAEMNVVLARRLYPRALLTPFTDDVDLTEADQREYAYLVDMQRLKGFQHVRVRFAKEEPEDGAHEDRPGSPRTSVITDRDLGQERSGRRRPGVDAPDEESSGASGTAPLPETGSHVGADHGPPPAEPPAGPISTGHRSPRLGRVRRRDLHEQPTLPIRRRLGQDDPPHATDD